MTDNSTASQRSRILAHLKQFGSLTTLQARHLLDIMHPSMRILELRELGFQITTIPSSDYTPEGNEHRRVAKYVFAKNRQLSLLDFLGNEVKCQ